MRTLNYTNTIDVVHPVAPTTSPASVAAASDSFSGPFHPLASAINCSPICFIQWHLQPVAATSVSSSGHVSVSTKRVNDDDTSGLQVPAWEISKCIAARLFPRCTLSAAFQDHVDGIVQSCLAYDVHYGSSMGCICDIVVYSAEEDCEVHRLSGVCSNYIAAPRLCNTYSCLAVDVHYVYGQRV